MVISKCDLHLTDLNGEVHQVRVTQLFLMPFLKGIKEKKKKHLASLETFLVKPALYMLTLN